MSDDPSAVIDASALLAYIFDEPGGGRLPRLAGDLPVISSVNWSEVVQKALQAGVAADAVRTACEEAGVGVIPFSVSQAEQAARLWAQTHSLGLSLSDRACLALAIETRAPALTADRTWGSVAVKDLQVKVLDR